MFNLLKRSKKKANKNVVASATSDDSDCHVRGALSDDEFDQSTRGYYRILNDENVRLEKDINNEEKYKYYVSQPFVGRESSSGIQRTKDKDDTAKLLGRKERNKSAKIDKNDGKESFRNKQSSKKNDNHKDLDCIEKKLEDNHSRKGFFNLGRKSKTHFPRKEEEKVEKNAQNSQNPSDSYTTHNLSPLETNYNVNVDKSFKPLDKVKGSPYKEFSKARNPRFGFNDSEKIPLFAGKDNVSELKHKAYLTEFDDLDDLDTNDLSVEKASTSRNFENEICFEAKGNDENLANILNEESTYLGTAINSDSQAKDVTSEAAKILLTDSNSAINLNTKQAEMKKKLKSEKNTSLSAAVISSSDTDEIFSAQNEVLMVEEKFSHLVANNDRTNAESLKTNRRFDFNLWQGHTSSNENSQLFINNTCQTNKNNNYQEVEEANNSLKVKDVANNFNDDDDKTSGDSELSLPANKVKDNSNRIFEKCCTIGATTIAILDLEVPKIKEEVKLRNSHSSIENKSNESKRQSRLSLTLSGFSLSSGKCKSSRAGSDDIIKNLKTNNQELKKRTSLFSKAKSESLERSDVETTNLNPFPEAGTNDSDIPKSSRKRWTFKHQRSSSLESKFPETTKEILDAKKNSIQRSKDFISDIFMARGRNNNRNRNHPQANQQQPCKYASNDNKQPKNNFNNEQKKAKYQPTNATPTTISKLVSGTNDSMQSSRNDQDHLHCNMHGNGATSSNKSRNVMNQNGNFSNKYDRDSVNKTNISSINTDTNSEKLHLEENVKVDPSATAETYQMTMSINRNKNICQIDSTTDSNKKNANFAFGRNLKDKRQMQNDYQTLHHQQDLNRCQTRQQMKSQEPPKDAVQYQANQRRSNSAEQIRDSPKKPKDDQLLLQHIANQRRSNSADEMRVPQHHSNINPTTVVHSTEVNKELENHAKDEHSENENFTHARNIEVRSTSVPDSSSDTEKRLSKSFACFATTSSPERVSEGKSLRSQETQETEETKTKTKQTEKESENENEQEKETETEKEAEAESSYGKQELNDLTECNDRNSVFLSKEFDDQNIDENPLKHQEGEELNEQEENIITMGQTNGKPESSQNSNSTRQNVQQAFRESQINSPINIQRQKSPVIVPTITVQDYSGQMDKSRHFPNSSEQEVFYDSENDSKLNDIHINSLPEKDVDGAFDFDEVDEVFAGGSSSSNGPLNFNGKWSSCHGHGLRFNHIKLENVPEESDAEEAAEKGNIYFKNKTSEENNLTKKDNNGNEPIFNESAREDDSEEEDREDDDDEDYSDHNNLDNETYANNFSPERSPLKSTNTSDSNLSTSFPDSGIGDSHCSSRTPLHSDSEPRQQSPKQQNQHSSHNLPFVRDGNSTDCDETLLQYDDLEYHPPFNSRISEERLVCIESISLPDVVVESTNSSSSSNTSINQNTYPSQTHSKHSKKTFDNIYDNVNNNDDDDDDGEHIININSGASSNNMGNVHFIPIHVESSSRNKKTESSLPKSSAFSTNNCQKRRSIDDSFLGSSSNSKNSSSSHHQQQHMPTIEIIEDENGKTIEFGGYEIETEKLKRELNNQKSKFSLQLDDAHKNVQNLQNKVEDMQTKIEKLEVELSTKTWNVERLQSELSAAHKDDEYVRKKLKILEDEKTILRHKISENEDEYKKKYEELEVQYNELDEKFQQSQKLATNLQAQVAAAQTEAEESRNELKMIRSELEEQIRILKNALENSEAERKICEDRWQKEFEMLRTHNIDREETIMTDCEWQLRQTQKQCKDRLDKSDHARQEALEKAKLLETELEDKKKKISDLKIYQAQMNSLRGVVQEQEHSIHTLMEQIKNLKADLETANENLKDQIDAVRKIKIHCDNAIYDKERQMIYRIDEVRHEAAAFWEDKLYTEMTRLKNELESVYIDERREALDKLQAEHIEELRALTTRYTANEDELQIELSELQEQLQRKGQEFLDLREKSDNALLQTRMHLDRADREYQNAMCREEEKREALELSLKKEFEDEKQDMEEKFRERLNQVKDEFAKELQITRQEMTQEHKKHLENQKAKLRAEKEEALQELADRHRKKLAAAEDRININFDENYSDDYFSSSAESSTSPSSEILSYIRALRVLAKGIDIELRHQRDLKDLKAAYDAEKAALDKRDISNANEIEQLHRKCRCLTNLFEEMRMRYERRDPRPEDLREIAELRTRCESQERDLYVLTDRLREMQIDMSEMQQQKQANNDVRKGKAVKKPPPKTIPTNCDVIYEENEERDSPPPVPLTPRDDDEDEDAESRDETVQKDTSNNKFERMMESRGDEKNVQINKNHINENDSRLITAL